MALNKRAVDIVLLPSEEIMDAALQMNQELLLRFGKKIVLNPNNCLPHLSLAMGALREEDLPDAMVLAVRDNQVSLDIDTHTSRPVKLRLLSKPVSISRLPRSGHRHDVAVRADPPDCVRSGVGDINIPAVVGRHRHRLIEF